MTCFQWKFHLSSFLLVVFSITLKLASILLIEELYSCSLIYISHLILAVAPSIEAILLVSKLFVCENNPSE